MIFCAYNLKMILYCVSSKLSFRINFIHFFHIRQKGERESERESEKEREIYKGKEIKRERERDKDK